MKAEASSSLVGNTVTSFLSGISGDQRTRILRCLLFAELSADKIADPKAAWEQWIDVYQQMLGVAGFDLVAPLDGGPVTVSNKKGFKREGARIVSRVRSRDLAAAAQGALDILFNSPHAQSFFKDWFNFSAGRSDSFQIIPCRKNPSNQIEIAVCALHMTTRTKLNRIPIGYWPFTYVMTLLLRGGSYSFNERRYEANRARIDRELVELRADRLREIQL